ncbi:MAG: low-specificity L-threonine aldolase [Burkholderiales bacterium]|nr:low-specificity L-threonine aldolase [Burkholderiales bacterium]
MTNTNRPLVDLRSDTVTRPTPAMREAMAAALLGDDVFGDDPTVNALQDSLAQRLGFEAALFMPSGTQSNLCAILAHCGRGDEYVVGQLAHTYRYEGGGAAVLGSVQPQPLVQDAGGRMALADVAGAIKPDDCHFARTRLLCLENTWNGHPMPWDYLQGMAELARDKGLALHLDGARLFNAAVAMAQETACADAGPPQVGDGPLGGQRPAQAVERGGAWSAARRITGLFDSVSVCFSKGLGAPVGSALCGSRELIARAHRIRKMAGGGMRQVGLLAAAAAHALDHHVERLADDHALVQRLALGLQGIEGLTVRSAQTNIVFVDVAGDRGPALLAFLKDHGVLATGLIGLRFVTHLDVDAAGIDHTIACVRQFFAQSGSAVPAGAASGPY